MQSFSVSISVQSCWYRLKMWCRNYSLICSGFQMNGGLQLMRGEEGWTWGERRAMDGGCREEWLQGSKSSFRYLCLQGGSPLSLSSPLFPPFLPFLPPPSFFFFCSTPSSACFTFLSVLSICLSLTSLPPSWPLTLALPPPLLFSSLPLFLSSPLTS